MIYILKNFNNDDSFDGNVFQKVIKSEADVKVGDVIQVPDFNYHNLTHPFLVKKRVVRFLNNSIKDYKIFLFVIPFNNEDWLDTEDAQNTVENLCDDKNVRRVAMFGTSELKYDTPEFYKSLCHVIYDKISDKTCYEYEEARLEILEMIKGKYDLYDLKID